MAAARGPPARGGAAPDAGPEPGAEAKTTHATKRTILAAVVAIDLRDIASSWEGP